MGQRFVAREKFIFSNGAIGWRAGTWSDCLGPWAKVNNCPIMVDNREVARLTAYASGYADTYWSIPANTRHRGQYIRGYFTQDDEGGAMFHVVDDHKKYFKK